MKKSNKLSIAIILFISSFSFSQAPGGSTSNLKLWLKSNTGVTPTSGTVTGWLDQTGFNTFSVVGTPTVNSNGLNFNPTIAFDGLSKFIGNTAINSSTEAFVVAKISNNTGASASGAVLGNPDTNSGDYFFHTEGGQLYCGNVGAIFSSTNAFGDTIPFSIMNSDLSESSAIDQRVLVNGLAYPNIAGNNPEPYSRIPSIGGRGFEYLLPGSEVAEVILYDASKSSDRQKIISYLGVKYGISLDQTVPTNYLASNGNILWDATANSLYKYNITGIGRDDLSVLNQLQSKSINSDALVTIGKSTITNTNVLNGGTFAADSDFLIFADNNASIDSFASVGAPQGRLVVARKWKVQETGTDATDYMIQVPSNSSTLNTKLPLEQNGLVYLLQDADGDFTNGATETTMVLNGTNWEVANIDLDNGQYFTFATINPQAPGGALANLKLWLKSNTGVTPTSGTVTGWLDQTGFNTFSVVGTPTVNSNGLNFNPTIAFDGLSKFIGNTAINSSTEAFVVAKISNNTGASASGAVLGNPDTNSGDYFFHTEGGQLYCGNVGAIFSSTNAFGDTIPFSIMNSDLSESSAIDQRVLVNGLAYPNIAGNNPEPYSRIPSIGGRGFEYLLPGSEVAEVILYDASKSSDRQKIISYLGVKYGISLDQTVPTNYLASNGNILWDATANSLYKYNITGIGRDDLSVLNQLQSKSINSDALVTIGKSTITNTNILNSGTFAANRDFLLVGDDNGSIGIFSNSGAPTNRSIVARKWKAQEMGTDATDYMIQVPSNSSTLNTKLPLEQNGLVYLLQDADGDFTNGATETTMVLNGTNWEAGNIDLNNGQYFTFASQNVLSTNNFENIQLSIHPNPSNAVFNIEIGVNATIELYDTAGKRLKSDKITLGATELNLSNYSDGVYFLKITNEMNQSKTVRLIKH